MSSKRGSELAWNTFIWGTVAVVIFVLLFFAVPQFYTWAKDFFKQQGGSGNAVVKVDGPEVIGYFIGQDEVRVFDGANFGSFPPSDKGDSVVELNDKRLNGRELRLKFLDFYFFNPGGVFYKSRGNNLVKLETGGKEAYLRAFVPTQELLVQAGLSYLDFISGGIPDVFLKMAGISVIYYNNGLYFVSMNQDIIYRYKQGYNPNDRFMHYLSSQVASEDLGAVGVKMQDSLAKWRDSVLVKPIMLEYEDAESGKDISEYYCVKLFKDMGGKGPALVVDLSAPAENGASTKCPQNGG